MKHGYAYWRDLANRQHDEIGHLVGRIVDAEGIDRKADRNAWIERFCEVLDEAEKAVAPREAVA